MCYDQSMESTIKQAVAALEQLPEDRQAELAAAVVALAAAPAHRYSDAENAAIDEGLADAEAGRFVTEEELQATLARFKTV